MKIVFIGQAAFGKDALDALTAQGESVVGVVTVPGKAGDPVKQSAERLKIPLLQTAGLNKPHAVEWVGSRKPDLLVLAFVTQFVPKAMIEASTYGGINYHPSLLPKYRGGSAINWTLIEGETETGVTIHFIDEGVDTGPVLLQEKVDIDPDDTVKSLYFNKLYPLGIKMIGEAVRLIRKGKARPFDQDPARASFQPVIRESDVLIDWTDPVRKIYNLIRGSNPSPGATTWFKGEKLKIWEARPYASVGTRVGTPGEILEISAGKGLVVGATDGAILIERVQFRDSGKISANDFSAASGLGVGDRLGKGSK